MTAPQEQNSGKLIVLETRNGHAVPKSDAEKITDKQEQADAPQTGERTEPHDLKGSSSEAGALTGGRSRRRKMAFIGAPALLVAAFATYVYWDNGGYFETTDDAFVAARQFPVSSKVAGYIASVAVTDNGHVNAGDVIAKLDDRDYQASLAQSKAQLAAGKANVANVLAETASQEAQIAQAKAQVDQSDANLVFARQQYDRYNALAKNGSSTVQNDQQYTSQLHQQEAALKTSQASLVSAQKLLDSYISQQASAQATLEQDEAELEQAKLNLSYTTVKAAQPGRVVQLSAAEGEYVQAGSSLAMFVPDKLWVTANFKETQLAKMRPRQPATVTIDAYPDLLIHGHVESVQPGSGTAFSLLPTENATGNYVKIVQRVPVKIVLDDVPSDVALGPGMSVLPTVRVDPDTSLWERMRSML
ncbi:HlyD family secretion protein [Rhizobium sp.]|jgi:membrane fusion protein, multidrug efflux system|uniref:HlyD family secretion protein n=1 Tax=Rhizobium sp. TaxID=391 RepID=UPI000E95FA11|nr:secretion protein HylD [Rhizobium sp.]